MWRRLFDKITLKVTGSEATMACQDDQLCAGLQERINGAIHRVQALWDENSSTEEWVFLLVDAKNAFNDINRVGMVWTVQHLWTSRARFVFNCYRHWSSLVLRNGNGTSRFLKIVWGVTQGYPLGMIAYVIGILPLIKNFKKYFTNVTQPCYADNVGAPYTQESCSYLFSLTWVQTILPTHYSIVSVSGDFLQYLHKYHTTW